MSATLTDLEDDITISQISKDDILNAKTYLDISAIDVEQSITDVEPDVIKAIDTDSEYTLLKQAWSSDIAVKNFYFLDATHYLKETDSELIIYEKNTASVDDWNGDKWTKLSSTAKTNILSSEMIKWGVTSTYGDTASSQEDGAVFYTLEVLSSTQFRFNFYKPLSEDGWDSPTQKTFTVNLRDLGDVLVPDYQAQVLNCYQDYSAYSIVHESTITSTHVGSKVIIGLHIDNALAQWILVFNYSDMSFDHIKHGFGYVGVNGTLTGGQFPDEFFDSDIGFSSTVHHIDDLQDFSTDDIESFSEYGCYGNAIQQWYVIQEVSQVVSHITFNESTDVFSAVYLPIECKYTALYESTSFYINKMTGFIPQTTTLFQMLPFDVSSLNSVLQLFYNIASPIIFYLLPTWTKMGFLQQSLGQYSYVYSTTSEMNIGVNTQAYKNVDDSSTQKDILQQSSAPNVQQMLGTFDKNDEVLSRDSLSFDKQEIEQTIDESNSSQSSMGGFWLAIMTQGIASIANASGQLTSAVKNKDLGNNAGFRDYSKLFSQFAAENALTAASTDIGVATSNTISLASKVTAVKTLDMFYSTSAHTASYFGPGYVCHQMIGQCIAQSISNRFIQGNQYGMFTVLTPLTTSLLELTNWGLKSTEKGLIMACEAAVRGMGGIGAWVLGTGTVTSIAAIVMGVIEAAIYIAAELIIAYNEFWISNLPKIIKCLCKDSANFFNAGNMSSHTIDIEAKHKYGSKHCYFMYPCVDAVSTTFTSETVLATTKDTTTYVNLKDLPITSSAKYYEDSSCLDFTSGVTIENVTDNINKTFASNLKGDITSRYIYGMGSSYTVNNTPQDMAIIEGTTAILPTNAFKNENIDSAATFTTPPIHDYIVDDDWELGVTAGQAGIIWTTVKDTKVIDGECSNMFINSSSCLLASSYTCVEVLQGIDTDYIRPIAYTPTTLAWNITGYNLCYDNDMYHAFDGVGYRITEWHGSSGLDCEHLAFVYNFAENDHLKRSNILPPNQFFGNFKSLPVISTESFDPIYLQAEIPTMGIGTSNDSPYEDRTQTRYALPVFVEPISTLPAVVKTLSSYRLDVYEGITALTTDIRTTQGKYKAPESQDFSINKQIYRATNEYICMINDNGMSAGDVVAKLGMTFIGATPEQAFFYSSATRAYYSFTGANTITKQDVWNRFKDIKQGRWDFINQEVVFECIGNMTRLYDDTSDTDTDYLDNLFIAHLGEQGIDGDITPPNKTIFDGTLEDDGGSWFKTYSFEGGLTYQGPNRFITNRFICLDYMLDDIVSNRAKWTRVSKDTFYPFRSYEDEFTNVETRLDETKVVRGWTHNPFLLCTSPMGVDKETDCMFEWELEFTWTDEMDTLYSSNNFACVNIMAQTMCPGGKKRSPITHLYLKKDLFTRGENTGYYSLRFQSQNGAGNREQLFIWSDAYIAMSSLKLEYKVITQKRQTPLAVSNIEVRELEEF